jgi:glycosyltransferase involved in cell wall biosynthesis
MALLTPEPFNVVIYCPDRHIQYDGYTSDRSGIGGGVTARIRMARALARAGHTVRMLANCPAAEMIEGVFYLPLGSLGQLQADIFIANSSGGDYDLGPLKAIWLRARLRILLLSGTEPPRGLEHQPFDELYVVSNFIADVARTWNLVQGPPYVSYNGFEEKLFRRIDGINNDPFRICYCSHPSKGLAPALGVLRRLRAIDQRYTLHVYGGHQLWGEPAGKRLLEIGVTDHGLVGQAALADALQACGYSLHLQHRLEPFGMVVTESMRAGCLPVASPVGAYQELIRSGIDGLLVQGDPGQEETLERAARDIHRLNSLPSKRREMAAEARRIPWNSDLMARSWISHWRWIFSGRPEAGLLGNGLCADCGGHRLALPDGLHCISCGRYQRSPSSVFSAAQASPI